MCIWQAVNKWEPSQVQIKNAAPHVKYEWDMFDELSNKYPFDFPNSSPLLESFLLHTRNLADFFYPKKNLQRDEQEDAVLARDYLPRWNFVKYSDFPHSLKEHYSPINKWLNHLSYTRLEKQYNWKDIPQIHEELSAVWHEFWKQLTTEQQSWFMRKPYT